MLTEEEIRMLLGLLKQEVVVKPSEKFPYTITKRCLDTVPIEALERFKASFQSC